MPLQDETRFFHFKFSIDNGNFVITTERDEDFERTAKVGPVISTIAQENQGNPFDRQREIHKELYGDVWKEYELYKQGEAPATDTLFEPGNGNGNGN